MNCKTHKVSATEHKHNVELENIIEEFGSAMRLAHHGYISRPPQCSHDRAPRFTPHMDVVWARYVNWCNNG